MRSLDLDLFDEPIEEIRLLGCSPVQKDCACMVFSTVVRSIVLTLLQSKRVLIRIELNKNKGPSLKLTKDLPPRNVAYLSKSIHRHFLTSANQAIKITVRHPCSRHSKFYAKSILLLENVILLEGSARHTHSLINTSNK
jgi:hypothetical protein